VAQINVLPAPAGCTPDEVFARWPSMADIPEATATAGTRVSVVQAADRDLCFHRKGIDYRFVDVSGTTSAATRAGRLAPLLRGLAPDVLHLHGLGFARDAFALRRHLPATPLVVQDHADPPPSRWLRLPYRRWYAAASGVAFTSAALAAPFTAAGLFAAGTRVFAIPESSSRFVPGDAALARAANGMHGTPCILSVGHLARGKDPLTVLDGFARAVPRLPDAQLWMAFGSAPMGESVRRQVAADSRLAGRVHLLGNLPHEAIQTALRAADLFVSGSHAESCGFALLEALACGVTPVVTDIPAFRALTCGRIGERWPVGDADALASALVRAATRRDAASAAAVRAHFDKALSFAAVGRRWADAYATLVHARREGAT
jgi:glycosyltransferase involved in cell wall biosynthesis